MTITDHHPTEQPSPFDLWEMRFPDEADAYPDPRALGACQAAEGCNTMAWRGYDGLCGWHYDELNPDAPRAPFPFPFPPHPADLGDPAAEFLTNPLHITVRRDKAGYTPSPQQVIDLLRATIAELEQDPDELIPDEWLHLFDGLVTLDWDRRAYVRRYSITDGHVAPTMTKDEAWLLMPEYHDDDEAEALMGGDGQ